MRIKLIASLVTGLLTAPMAYAGTVTVDHGDLKLTGGFAASAVKSDNYYTNGGNDANDIKTDIDASDILVEISSDATKSGVGFTLGLGRFLVPNVLDGGKNRIYSNSIYDSFKAQYAYATVVPTTGLTIDAGILATNVGYELVPSFKNPNITTSATWNGQPGFYPGARATYAFTDSLKAYAEANTLEFYPATKNNQGVAFGVLGSASGVNYVINYMKMDSYKDLIDIVASGSVGGVDLGMNLDYSKIQKCGSGYCNGGTDNKAMALALYVTPKAGKMSYPVRAEYITDGAGVYVNRSGVDMNKAYTLTITPTYKFTDSTFVRAEVSYVKAKDKAFYNEAGTPKDTLTSFAVQAGLTF